MVKRYDIADDDDSGDVSMMQFEDGEYVTFAEYAALAARLAEAERLLLASDHDPYNEHIRDGDEWLTRWRAFFGTRITDSAEGGL